MISPRTGTFDLAKGEDFGTDISYGSPGNGVLFVGRKAQPNLQRFHVLESGELQLTGQLGLDAYGITDTLGRSQPVVQFIDDEHAYYIDLPTLQVVVFNPSATPMTIYPDDAFLIDGLKQEGMEVNVTAVRRDGDQVTVMARYYLNDNAAPLVKVALIDTKTHRRVLRADATLPAPRGPLRVPRLQLARRLEALRDHHCLARRELGRA